MKASDKLRNEIKLKEIQISEIQSEVEKRNTFLQTKTIHSVLAKTKYPFLPVYYGHKYYLHGKEIPKAEFDKVLSELNELHKTDYETIKLLNHEIKLLEGALEQALFEEANKITVKSKGKTSRDFETELHYIIKIVSTWKNIEGNYSQSKLAAKMNKPRYYLTRLFAHRFTYMDIERTFKQHLIERVQAGIETARKSKYDNKDETISRLNHFHDCLVQNRVAVGLEYSYRRKNKSYNKNNDG